LSLFREVWSWVKEDPYTNLIQYNSDGKIGLVQIKYCNTIRYLQMWYGGAFKRRVRLDAHVR